MASITASTMETTAVMVVTESKNKKLEIHWIITKNQ